MSASNTEPTLFFVALLPLLRLSSRTPIGTHPKPGWFSSIGTRESSSSTTISNARRPPKNVTGRRRLTLTLSLPPFYKILQKTANTTTRVKETVRERQREVRRSTASGEVSPCHVAITIAAVVVVDAPALATQTQSTPLVPRHHMMLCWNEMKSSALLCGSASPGLVVWFQ